jgi:hypothetical protein
MEKIFVAEEFGVVGQADVLGWPEQIPIRETHDEATERWDGKKRQKPNETGENE